jgi:hypothetical protein
LAKGGKNSAFRPLFFAWVVPGLATLQGRTTLLGPAMQINRLNLIFPPHTPGTPGAAVKPDALPDEPGHARASTANLGPAPSGKPMATSPLESAAEDPSPPAGVTLVLGEGQRTHASGVYTREGVVAGRASAAVDQTPAEQFVASAVNILRDFDIGKATSHGNTASYNKPDALQGSRFGGLKQVVAKLNVFA